MNTDRDNYLPGDTLWYTLWLLDAYYHKPSTPSGIAYVELLSPGGGVVLRQALRVNGLEFSQMALGKELPSGDYELRGYTRWQRNFGDSLYFRKTIHIFGNREDWRLALTSARHGSSLKGDSIWIDFVLSGRELLVGRKLRLEVLNAKGKRIISADRLQSTDGHFKVNFGLDSSKDLSELSFRVVDKKEGQDRVSFPLSMLDTSTVDLQFLPEGGHMVSGLENKVAFRALDARGRPLGITGVLKDSDGNTLTTVGCTHDGMGTFTLVPRQGYSYTISVAGHGNYALPVADNAGTQLSLDNLSDSTHVLVRVASRNAIRSDYYLFSMSHGLVVTGQKVAVDTVPKLIKIPKNVFPTGVSHFSLMGPDGQLLNERAFYVDNGERLRVGVGPGRDSLLTRDSVPLEIEVRDAAGNPVRGVFTLCVTDTSRTDKNPASANLLSYNLLSSELRGRVHEPGFYFDRAVAATERDSALDVLLLTQGFVRYEWDTTKQIYPAEAEFTVSGRASKMFNKPYSEGNIGLFALKPSLLTMDTVTDREGRFTFRGFPAFDTAAFLVKARTKKGKSFGIGVEVDRYDYPEVTVPKAIRVWKGDVDLAARDLRRMRDRQLEEEYMYHLKPGELAPVTVRAKQPVEGSDNLNGPGQYDEAINKKQLQQMGDTSLLDILYKRIKTFRFNRLSGFTIENFYRIKFIIDGLRIDDPMIQDAFTSSITECLQYYKASDIKGI
ncbi:MAG: hypothetical protein DI598_16185, partial [Pseudopedobacter saltans]